MIIINILRKLRNKFTGLNAITARFDVLQSKVDAIATALEAVTNSVKNMGKITKIQPPTEGLGNSVDQQNKTGSQAELSVETIIPECSPKVFRSLNQLYSETGTDDNLPTNTHEFEAYNPKDQTAHLVATEDIRRQVIFSKNRCGNKVLENKNTMLTFRNPDTRFEIAGDRTQFELIVQDMLNNGGNLVPSNHWNWNLGDTGDNLSGYTNELFDEKYSQLSKMLDPWVGITGMQVLSEKAVEKWECFLRQIDHMQLLPSDILTHGKLNGWRETDLGSILDLSLITIFLANKSRERLAICEVGGGYGRLQKYSLKHTINECIT